MGERHDLPTARVAVFLYRRGAHGELEYLIVDSQAADEGGWEPLIAAVPAGQPPHVTAAYLAQSGAQPMSIAPVWYAGHRYGLPLWGSDAARLPGQPQVGAEEAFAAETLLNPTPASHEVRGSPARWVTAFDAAIVLRYPEHVEALLTIDAALGASRSLHR